ncbi:low temperature requirement protein A [Novosphingobium lentum]|uniref:low temperature requirement protein A n=1 Tax=Novosphingobium lentum TaxID=145287 RepID=UPI0008306C04|nr:low temperature requirement protein A [Novosphingobium lentum]
MADAPPAGHRSLLRNHGGGHATVSYLELFFDLVYVFAITQLSHFLLKAPGWIGLAEMAVLFLAVWWAWMYTTWAANWADPERVPVRLMLLVAMLLSLLMAAALPEAFGDRAGLFAGSYVVLQLGRTLFMAWVMGRDAGAEGRDGARNMLRISTWFALSAPLWLHGAFGTEGMARLGLWAVALAIEYLGPVAGFRTPGLGRSLPSDWNISGSHMAERCALFIIIALGEGIVVTGASFAEREMTAARIAGFALAFLSSILMWWIYFDVGAQRGASHIEHHAEPGRVARNAYTYLHMPIVAGVVITAVADALLLEQPGEPADARFILVMSGGLLVYLAGLGLFKRFSSTFGNFPLSHFAGGALLIALAGWASLSQAMGLAAPSRIVLAGAATLALVLVAAWEWGSLHGGWKERFSRPAKR